MSTSVHRLAPARNNSFFSSSFIPSSIDLSSNQKGFLFPTTSQPTTSTQQQQQHSNNMYDLSQQYALGAGQMRNAGAGAISAPQIALGNFGSNISNPLQAKNAPTVYENLFNSITSHVAYHSREDPTINRLQQYIVNNHLDLVDKITRRMVPHQNGNEWMDNTLRERIFHAACLEFREILRQWCESSGSPSSYWLYKNINDQFYGSVEGLNQPVAHLNGNLNTLLTQSNVHYVGNVASRRSSTSGGSNGSESRISPLVHQQQQQFAQQHLHSHFGSQNATGSFDPSTIRAPSSPFSRQIFPHTNPQNGGTSSAPFNMMQSSTYPSQQQQQHQHNIREHSLFQSSNDDYPIDLLRIVQRKQPPSSQLMSNNHHNMMGASTTSHTGEYQSQQPHFEQVQPAYGSNAQTLNSGRNPMTSSSDSTGSLFSTDGARGDGQTNYIFQPPRNSQQMLHSGGMNPQHVAQQQQQQQLQTVFGVNVGTMLQQPPQQQQQASFHINMNHQNTQKMYAAQPQEQLAHTVMPPAHTSVAFQPYAAAAVLPTAPQLNYNQLQQQLNFQNSIVAQQQQLASYCVAAQMQQQQAVPQPKQQAPSQYATNYTANPKPLTREKNALASSSSEMPPLPQQHPDHHYPSFWLYNIGNTDFYITSNYEARNILGFGAYGIVISAYDSKSESEVAIKKQNLSNFGGNREYLKRLLREICILHHVDHPNLMCLVDLIPPFDFQHFESVYIVTQKMDHSLKDVIHSKQELKQEHIDYFMYQMTSAIRYLHSCHLIHRDLKPENVLINDNCELRLSDFGLSKSIPLGLNPKNSTSIVSLFYRAPELLLGINQCSPSIDIWSLGTIFAEMYYPPRKPLFQSNSCYDALGKILSLIGTPNMQDLEGLSDHISNEGYQYLTSLPYYKRRNFREVFPTASPEAIDLIEKMLVFNPARRITAEDALQHPYFKNIEFHEDEFKFVCERMDTSWEEEFNDQKKDPKAILFKKIVEFNLQQNNCLVNGKYTILGEKHCVGDDLTEFGFD